jgi:hypothetical protein
MPTYVEYKLDDKTTILIEAPEGEGGGLVLAANEEGGVATVKANKTFAEALKNVNTQAKMLLKEVNDLQVEEAEIKFGINTVGELGNIAIGKVGVGVNYEITLKWKKPVPVVK